MYGSSTGRAPIQVNNRTLLTKAQKLSFATTEKEEVPRQGVGYNAGTIRIKILKAKATTPPSLLGIDRRMA